MPVTYQSSIGSNLTISSGAPEAEGAFEMVDQTYGTAAAMGQVAGDPGGATGVSATADAAAFGTNTLAQVSGSIAVSDGTSATTTQVELDALAAAQSADDFVLTSTYIDVSYYGGGSYLSITQEATHMQVGNGTTTSTSSSSVTLVVLDLNGGSGTISPDDLDEPSPDGYLQPAAPDGCQDPGYGDDADGISLDGNVAFFDVTASAFGNNTMADVVIDAFALEDAMSTVTVVLDVAAY